jgi:hypothetical protein
MDEAYHYPPDLLETLVDAVGHICRSKTGVIDFFRGAGTPELHLTDLRKQLERNPKELGKFQIARTVLIRVNEAGDSLLGVRREIIKRIVEFESFDQCWENDRLKARGLVAQVREAVNVKDSFTRLNIERKRAEDAHREAHEREAKARSADAMSRETIRSAFFALFAREDADGRGRALEGVLNDLFALDGILVREAFTRRGSPGEGVVEQIDGVIQLDGHLYLVEMKWRQERLGPGDVAQHLVRVYGRADMRGLFLSYSDFTPAALDSCREALHERVVTLATLQELVNVLHLDGNLGAFLRAKVIAAMVEKKPFVSVL